MMRIGILLLVSAGLLLPFTVLSQKRPVKFGEISKADFDSLPSLENAHAVVLVDFGESRIEYTSSDGFYLMFERIRRIGILSKDGYDWANLTIPLYRDGSEKEQLMGLKAVTYNLENGRVVESKLKNDGVFEEDADQNIRLTKIAMPNVKEGSIIEINYNIKSPFFYNYQDWTFQSRIPVVWSEYRAHIPHFFGYKKVMQGYLELYIDELTQEHKAYNITSFGTNWSNQYIQRGSTAQQQRIDYDDNINRWVVKNAPPFVVEPHMTTPEDYVTKVKFELSHIQMPGQHIRNFNDSWDRLNQSFLNHPSFGGVITGSSFLGDYVANATQGLTDSTAKLHAVYNKVKSMLAWDGQRRKYSVENLKKVLEAGKGSSAEINLMLVNMLRKAGLKSDPVLISTRDNGFVRIASPVPSQFNYVVAAVTLQDKVMLLDATDRSLPMHMLPERCLNGQGYMIAENGYGWIEIKPTRSRSGASGQLTLADDGLLRGKMQLSNDGYFAQERRLKYVKLGEEKYVEELSKEHGWMASSRTLENMEKIPEPVKESYDVEFHQTAQKSGDKIYLNPVIMGQVRENPFTPDTRKYPVDFASPREWVLMVRIALPAGWEIEELPQPRAIAIPANGAKFSYNMTVAANTITLTSQLIINKTIFSPEEYHLLREFYAQVVSKHAESIVLKRK